MQLSRASRLLLSCAAGLMASAPLWAHADDRADFTTTWYQERRGVAGSLTVIHPQLDLGIDIGESLSLGAGYSSDVVTGATASVYAPDAVSTATQFDDVRNEGRVSVGLKGNRSKLSVTASSGVERDYTSLTVSANASVDMPGKNTNLALGYSHNFDRVCDRDNRMVENPRDRRALTGFDPCKKTKVILGDNLPGMTVWESLEIDSAQATLTQNISPTVVGQASLYGEVLRGFQANPYRKVRVAGGEPQESLPEVRGRLAVLLRVNKFLKSLDSAVHASVRGYSDTWEVNALSLEGAYSQYFGHNLLTHFRARVYQQTPAKFFKDAFFYDTEDAAGSYWTGDRELAPVRNVLLGAKLSYISFDEEGGDVFGVFDEVRFNLKADVLLLDQLPADPISQNQAGISRQFLTNGQLIDAFVLQLGLITRY